MLREQYFDIRIPDTGDEFEKLTQTVCKYRFGEDFERYGRSGQTQSGIDLFSKNYRICIQCKNYQGYNATRRLLGGIEPDFLSAVNKFQDSMRTYILATTVQRDTSVQDLIVDLSRKHPDIEIKVLFWEDFKEILRQKPELIRAHNSYSNLEEGNYSLQEAANVQYRVSFSDSEGSLFLYSADSKSKEHACRYTMPQNVWVTFQKLIRRYVSSLFHTEEDYVAVTLRDTLDKKCAPIDGTSYFDKEFRINFEVSFLTGRIYDTYDSFRVDVGHSFSLTFFKNGSYIYHTIPADSRLTDLGLDEEACVAISKELLEFLHPNNELVTATQFESKVFSDFSGGYYLRYLVK